MTEYPTIKIAAAHAALVFLDAARTVDKACSLIAEAAGAGAKLLAFPGSFIPGFPSWPGAIEPRSQAGPDAGDIHSSLTKSYCPTP